MFLFKCYLFFVQFFERICVQLKYGRGGDANKKMSGVGNVNGTYYQIYENFYVKICAKLMMLIM